MQQVLSGSSSDVLNTAATEYIAFWPNEAPTWTATENARRQIVAGNGRIKWFRVNSDIAAGAGAFTINLRKNGAAAGPTVALTHPATTGVDLTNVATFAAGDVITLESVPSGTPTNTPKISWTAVYEDTDTFEKCLFMGGINNTMGTALAENSAISGGEIWGTKTVGNINYSAVCAVPFTFKDMYVLLSAAPGVGTSYNLRPNINGGAGGVAVTISGASTSGNDTSLGNAAVRGDALEMREAPSGTPTARQAFWGIGALTGNPHEFMLFGTSQDALNSLATEYNVLNGSGIVWDGTEANRSAVLPQCTLHSLIVLPGVGTAVGTTFTFTIMKNGVATSLAVTVDSTGATQSDLTNFVEYSDGDTGSIQCAPTLGVPGAINCAWAVVCRKAFYSLPIVGAGI